MYPMRYLPTRGQTPPKSFRDILLAGLASDRGLYAPEAWPQVSADEIARFASQPYADTAFDILRRFTGDAFTDAELKADIAAAYASFETSDMAPLVEIGRGK